MEGKDGKIGNFFHHLQSPGIAHQVVRTVVFFMLLYFALRYYSTATDSDAGYIITIGLLAYVLSIVYEILRVRRIVKGEKSSSAD